MSRKKRHLGELFCQFWQMTSSITSFFQKRTACFPEQHHGVCSLLHTGPDSSSADSLFSNSQVRQLLCRSPRAALLTQRKRRPASHPVQSANPSPSAATLPASRLFDTFHRRTSRASPVLRKFCEGARPLRPRPQFLPEP